ncbi:hypothetical protein [Methylocapsa palsarum]|uniref:Uncharacterized protein n=1 Tax=Methylocapsa palsarum TaxID=1612308 RepID=A0A1I4C558_9HYPH|nr:hypothetical protein [Methylocapsa palsarum]SFK75439.1 hypothetical protein SAMN05444581_11815 [Methylocapsa palsarum]
MFITSPCKDASLLAESSAETPVCVEKSILYAGCAIGILNARPVSEI